MVVTTDPAESAKQLNVRIVVPQEPWPTGIWVEGMPTLRVIARTGDHEFARIIAPTAANRYGRSYLTVLRNHVVAGWVETKGGVLEGRAVDAWDHTSAVEVEDAAETGGRLGGDCRQCRIVVESLESLEVQHGQSRDELGRPVR